MKRTLIGILLVLASVAAAQNTVFAVVASEAELSQLAEAIAVARLEATLEQSGPYTVFAPTDAAWDRLSDGQVTHLLNNLGDLRNVLNLHLVEGRITPDALRSVNTLHTVEGQVIAIRHGDDGAVRIDDGNLDTVDATVLGSFETDNGVVYIIDHVMKPGIF